jgi:hypothetical protein
MASDFQFVLRRDQRDDIMRAVGAVLRRLQKLESKPDTQDLWVIGTNLTIIQDTLTNLPQESN